MTILITSVTMLSKLKQALKQTKGKKGEKYAKYRYTEKRENMQKAVIQQKCREQNTKHTKRAGKMLMT